MLLIMLSHVVSVNFPFSLFDNSVNFLTIECLVL